MFKTFPEFSKLTLADKDEYEAYIKDFPPIYDISFTGLLSWWNQLESARVAKLNDGMALTYWLPGDDEYSGLCFIGKHKIDESICAIFDYLKEKGEPVRLVNVPEFVVSNVQYPEMFNFKNDRRYDEYILPINRFYPLQNMNFVSRKRVERSLSRIGHRNIVTKSIDLTSAVSKKLLTNALNKWMRKGINDYGKVEYDAIAFSIQNSGVLGIHNLCLFVGGELYGFCLFESPLDKRYVIVKHIKATHNSTLGFELIGYMFAKWFAEQGAFYVNVCEDFGILRLRMFMLTLGPVNFFRKYRIEPAKHPRKRYVQDFS